MKSSIAAAIPEPPAPALEAVVSTFARALAAAIAPYVVAELKQAGSAPAQRAEPLVTIQELAAALVLSETTIRRMVREGCPVEYYGGSQRFDCAAVRAWARERGKQKAATQPRRAPAVTDEPIPGVVRKTRKGRG